MFLLLNFVKKYFHYLYYYCAEKVTFGGDIYAKIWDIISAEKLICVLLAILWL
jgi:hypothetical protein